MSVPVARRNLFAEKGRFAISVAGVAFAVPLILIVVALYRGWSRTGQTFEEMPGDLWVVQHGTSDPFHSISLLQRSQLDRAAAVPGVRAVVPVLARAMTFRTQDGEVSARLLALDLPAELRTAEMQRRYAPDGGGMIIDETLSRKSGLAAGDRADFGTASLTVTRVGGRSGEALQQFVFVNFADAETVFGVGDIVSYGLVMLERGADAGAVQRAITASDPGLQVYTKDGFATSIRKEIDDSFLPIITILVGIGFVVGAAVVGLTIYTATIERTREFGVMKAVGASAGFVYRIVLSQAAMLTATGFAVGLAGAWGVAQLAVAAVPEFMTVFRWQDIASVFGAAILMALVSSFVPVRRLNSIDPAVVFRA